MTAEPQTLSLGWTLTTIPWAKMSSRSPGCHGHLFLSFFTFVFLLKSCALQLSAPPLDFSFKSLVRFLDIPATGPNDHNTHFPRSGAFPVFYHD